ncbi:MAG TPA: WecB/TagA/CpsF family glycosyltransferase [Chthoniobacterales bacterium]
MKVAGIDFFSGTEEDAISLTMTGGLVLAPSGPGIAYELVTNSCYRNALAAAKLVLPDSGAMVLAWNTLHGWQRSYRLARLSGLRYLRALIANRHFRQPGATFWVMPSENDLTENLEWLKNNGLEHLSRRDCYLAPTYSRSDSGEVADSRLAEILEQKHPRFVVLNVGGGTQEQLGFWLSQHLDYRPSILCTGAAIAFLSGRQTNIPPWADRAYLGWLLRSISAPRKFIPRYWQARSVFWVIWKYGSRSPDLRSEAKRLDMR